MTDANVKYRPDWLPQGTSFLFIAGCERTGTTALLRLLNSDSRIVLGKERFKFICKTLAMDHFRPSSFFQPNSEQTNFLNADYYAKLQRRWEDGGIRYIGDKNPMYFNHLDRFASHFREAKFLFTFRDLDRVADSYNARARNPEDVNWPENKDFRIAVRNWHQSLSCGRRFHFNSDQNRVFFVEYEKFFSGDEQYLEALYGFVELPLTPEVLTTFRAITKDWAQRASRPLGLSDEEADYVTTNRDEKLEAWYRNISTRQLKRMANI